MSTIGIKVLFVGKSWDVPFEYETCNQVAQLFGYIAKYSPDIIVTSDEIPSSLNVADFEIRKKWIHQSSTDSVETVMAAIEMAYYNNIWGKHRLDYRNPLISIYTGTYNTGDMIQDTYQSLRDQSYKNWEWVVVDDESVDGTWEWLLNQANKDHRIRPIKIKHSGKIGNVKDIATRMAHGVYLVELDHDDMLVDSALFDIWMAFASDASIGMVYSNFAEFYADGSPHRYGGEYWRDRYRDTEYRGKVYAEAIAPDIYGGCGSKCADLNVYYLTRGPNHVRAFRTSEFRRLGGYNYNLPVADDWDLFVRFFLHSKCHHINKLLYLYRFQDNNENTTRVRFDSIQYHLNLGRKHYGDKLEEYAVKKSDIQEEKGHKSIQQVDFRKAKKQPPEIKVIALTFNEMASLPGFFGQFAHITNDFNILDSGSTDGTLEWAKEHGIKVIHKHFDRFDNQRNYALKELAGDCDWVIMLDPDERLDRNTLAYLPALLHGKYDIYISPLVAEDGEKIIEFVPKAFLFRNSKEIHWVNPVHEKLIGSLKQAKIKNAQITHMIGLHSKERRQEMAEIYNKLGPDAPLRDDYPILNYKNRDDNRIAKIFLGPPVSVVIPTYDRLELLKRAVYSAINQDYFPKEIIVVGDGCPRLSEMDLPDSVCVYNLASNHGAGGAAPRNQGIVASTTDWIAYLDDDNVWAPNHLSSIMSEILKAKADFGLSSMSIDDKILFCDEPQFGKVDTSMLVHKKILVQQYGWWKDRDEDGYAHDWKFVERFIKGGAKWAVTKKPTLIYNAATSGQKQFLMDLIGKQA